MSRPGRDSAAQTQPEPEAAPRAPGAELRALTHWRKVVQAVFTIRAWQRLFSALQARHCRECPDPSWTGAHASLAECAVGEMEDVLRETQARLLAMEAALLETRAEAQRNAVALAVAEVQRAEAQRVPNGMAAPPAAVLGPRLLGKPETFSGE